MTPANVVLVSSGIIALLGYALVIIGYGRVLRKGDQNAQLEKICRDLVRHVHETAEIPYDRVAAHVWTLRGFRGARHLERRARFVPRDRKETRIVWRRGKGAIGLCWARNETLVADLAELEAAAPDEETFCKLPRERRFGFSWQEFQETRHYRAILAVPLRGGPAGAPRIRGVLSVDVELDGQAHSLDNLARTDKFSAVLSVCEAVLGKGG